MKPYHSIVATILLALLAGCATTPQLRQVSSEEAFSEIRTLAKEKSQSPPEWEVLYTQPVNKSVSCKLHTSQGQLDRNNFRAYWDGECKDGFAYGLGRDIAISDTHHLEEITIYGDHGRNQVSHYATYDFVDKYVTYRMTDDKGVVQYMLVHKISNEGEKFFVENKRIEFTENGYNQTTTSPLSNTSFLRSKSGNVQYKYTINEVNINNKILTLHFQTLDAKGSPIGFQIGKYANGRVKHAKVNNAELVEVELPKEYLSMVKDKFQEIVESDSRIVNKIEQVRRMENKYLNQTCNGKHEILGLEKKVSNKICTWRNQFKEPFELAQNRFNQSIERMKAEAQEQAEQQKIQEQLNYEKRMAEAAERKKESESVSALQMFQLFSDGLNAFADGLNGTSNAYRYRPPTSSYNSYTPSNRPSGYRSSTGRTYQYDLSDPRQRALYRADPRARLRDRIEPDVLRRNDQNMGQYGGGILRNKRGAW